MSELFKNIERSMFTLNMNNIVEICFDKINEQKTLFDTKNLSMKEKAVFDNCIDKYLQSFNIVSNITKEHIEPLFENK